MLIQIVYSKFATNSWIILLRGNLPLAPSLKTFANQPLCQRASVFAKKRYRILVYGFLGNDKRCTYFLFQ